MAAQVVDAELRYRDGLRAAAPLVLAALAFGASFGALARTSGMSPLAATLMSATTFGGSAQIATASVLGAGGGLAAAVSAGLLLNLRYGPMGLSVAPALASRPRWWRAVSSQMMVDESWALAQRDGRVDRHLMIGAGLALYLPWTLGTALGALAGDLIADPSSLGMDAAFPAVFLALLVPQLRSRTRLLAALAGAAIALALVPVASAGVPIIVAGAACLVGALRPTRARS